ncbi:MAG: diaminopimelate epimerase [Pseudomonadales bacterium]|nr:diaminopimelate epimerase [Pseudomonadales bacterium]
MLLRFSKMHGIGNDFIVIDCISQRYTPQAHHMKKLADRHFGIGCDQLLIVEPPQQAENDFRYRIFNADGSEVEQCGNGARCFARYVYDRGLIARKHIKVETAGGNIELYIESDGIRVNMGAPILTPLNIPFKTDTEQTTYNIEIDGQSYKVGAVSMGNPHLIYQVDDIDNAPIETLGPLFEAHSDFPKRCNAGFMQVIDRGFIKLRVYERGAAETLACGSGACAAVVSGILQGLLDHKVTVQLPGGKIHIEWLGGDNPVFQVGPAEFVFDGKIRL